MSEVAAEVMSDNESVDSWLSFLEFAKSKFSSTSFDNWLAPIICMRCCEEECVLKVPNVFVQEYLLSNFEEDLRSFLPVDSSGKPVIKFLIEDTPAPKILIETRENQSGSSDIKLNKSYVFDSFIEGTCNQFVKSAAFGIASRPGRSYNPFFMYGHVGLGKTHLLHAIGRYVINTHRKLKVQCITAEEFVNALVDSLRNKTTDKLKRYYRSLDVLLVDDIQFLQDRVNFENEFCNMFESLINQSRQVVVTSDKSPGELKLSERMVARMEWGLVAQLGMPDLETRVAILQYKAEMRGISLPQKTAFSLAQQLNSNIRQLEGAINRLCAQSRLLDLPITENLINQTLQEVFVKPASKTRLTVDDILETVGSVFKVKVMDILGTKRCKQIVSARQVAMFLARELVQISLVSLGVAFQKTHSTILHACRVTEQKLSKDKSLLQKTCDSRNILSQKTEKCSRRDSNARPVA